MLTRRNFFNLAILPMALGGCSAAQQASFRSFASALYADTKLAAQKLEAAVAIGRKDMAAAAEFLQPYLQPVCQIVVTLVDLGNKLIAAGALNGKSDSVRKALATANALAADPIIVSIANTGALPPNPVQTLVGIIHGVTLIIDLTQGKVTPSASVAGVQ